MTVAQCLGDPFERVAFCDPLRADEAGAALVGSRSEKLEHLVQRQAGVELLQNRHRRQRVGDQRDRVRTAEVALQAQDLVEETHTKTEMSG